MVVAPIASRGPDRVVWVGEARGRFSTKSAYNLVIDCLIPGHGNCIWKEVWRLKGLQRVRVFMWRFLNQGF